MQQDNLAVSAKPTKTPGFKLLLVMHAAARLNLLYHALLIAGMVPRAYGAQPDDRFSVVIAGLYLIVVGVGFAGLSLHVEKVTKGLFLKQSDVTVSHVGTWGGRVVLVAFYFAVNLALLILAAFFLGR